MRAIFRSVRRSAVKFLIFKECIHNAVRHAGCRNVRGVLECQGHRLLLRFSDDGRGFLPSAAGNGHGLSSMRRRAVEVGGELWIQSKPGSGTTITLEIPLQARAARV